MILSVQSNLLNNPNNYTVYNKRKTLNAPVNKKFINPITFTGDSDIFDVDKRYKENLKEYGFFSRNLGSGKKKAKEKTINELNGFNINRNALVEQKNETIKAMKETTEAKERALQAEKEKTEILKQQLEEAKKNGAATDSILRHEKELEELSLKLKNNVAQVEADKARIEKTIKDQELNTARVKDKGWSKIAGNDSVKTQLDELFINKLALEKNEEKVHFPNSILFYGPKGTGKTLFAEAFAEQTKCNFVSIDMMQDDEDIIQDLINIGKSSRKNFDKDGIRTIILLDEFDSVAQLNSEEKNQIAKEGKEVFAETNVGSLKNFLEKCADKYKCTVFMTTNHPLNIDSSLFANENIIPVQVYLGAPNTKDAAEILKYHLEKYTQQPINYEELGEIIGYKNENNNAFSAGRIANIVQRCKDNADNIGQKITNEDVKQQINEVGPDIDESTINRFKTEIEEMESLHDDIE